MADVPYLPYGEGVNPSNWVVNEDINAVDFYGNNISPVDICHDFVPGSWVIVQVTPILHAILILHCYMPIDFIFYSWFITSVGILQVLLKRQMKFVIQRCTNYL